MQPVRPTEVRHNTYYGNYIRYIISSTHQAQYTPIKSDATTIGYIGSYRGMFISIGGSAESIAKQKQRPVPLRDPLKCQSRNQYPGLGLWQLSGHSIL